jgi:hypothetical protein
VIRRHTAFVMTSSFGILVSVLACSIVRLGMVT